MIETLFFILGQITINLVVYWMRNTRLTTFFIALSYPLFVMLLLLYPYLSYRIPGTNNLTGSYDSVRCGNAYLGSVFSQYFIGGIVAMILQWQMNTRLVPVDDKVRDSSI